MRSRTYCVGCALLSLIVSACTNNSKPLSPDAGTASSALIPADHGQGIFSVVVKEERWHRPSDGQLTRTRVITTSYDKYGHPLLIDDVTDGLAPVVDRHVVTTSEYDKNGNLLHLVEETDQYPVDGSIEHRITGFVTAYDDRGNPTEHVYEQRNLDGTLVLRSTMTSIYNQQNRPIHYVGTTDVDLTTPLIDFTSTHALSYDAHGNVIRDVSEYVWDRGGFVINSSALITAEYNSHGAIISRYEENSEEGVVNFRGTLATVAFDQRGNPVERVTERDSAADGIIDEREPLTTEYDAQRRPIREVFVYHIGIQVVSTYRYDGPGTVGKQSRDSLPGLSRDAGASGAGWIVSSPRASSKTSRTE